MSDYKCINPFFSHSGKQYYYGNKISQSQYLILPPSEQRNFIQDYEDEGRVSSGSNYDTSSSDTSWLYNIDTSPSSDYSSGSDSGSDSSSNFDFGGGDTGGGGVSGDW